jgi:hypothetical protein
MQRVVVTPRHRVRRSGSPRAGAARRPGPTASQVGGRRVREQAVTAAIASVAAACALAARSLGTSVPVALLVGVLVYVGIVLLAELVHLDDRLPPVGGRRTV